MDKRGRSEPLIAIGARVRQRRRELNLTQEALAGMAALSKSFVSEVESGQTSPSGLVYLKLAEALGVSVEWLLRGELPEALAVNAGDVRIPPLVAELAEEQGWSYGETLDVAAALQSIVARRTRGGGWQPEREQVLALARAVRSLRPATAGGKGKP